MPIRFKHGIEVDGSVTVDGQALGSNAFNSTTIPTHTSNLTNDSGFITQTAADLRYLQGIPQETGYNIQFLSSAIEMYDQATGGDLSWVVGADDRGGVGAAGQNAFVVRYGRGSRFNSSWRTQGTEAMTIDDSGRVGFTAPTPDTRFEIRDNGFTNNRLRIRNAGGSGNHDSSIELVNDDDGAGHTGGTWLARSYGWGNASLQLGGTTTGQWSGRYNISTTQKTYFENSGGVGIRVVPDTTLDVAGEITGRGGDTGLIFKSRNTSATGAPDQFQIKHNLGSVEILNPRGDINFTTALKQGGNTVATQSWVEGRGYVSSSDLISEPNLISGLSNVSVYNHYSGTRPTDSPSGNRGAGIQFIGSGFSAGLHVSDGLYYRGANGTDISLGVWYKVASQDWVESKNYLDALPSHSHTFASLTEKPTTLSGYGITDAASSTHSHTAANVHSWLYSTGGDANDYTTLGIYRNYAVNGPIGGHNTILNIMQSDGRYGFQLGANTTSEVDGLYYRSKDATIGATWYQVASRDWVESRGYFNSLPAHTHDYLPLTGGIIESTNTYPLAIRNSTNAAGAGIEFSDQTGTYEQKVYITARHSDTQSEGSGASIHLTGNQGDFSTVSDKFIATGNSTAEPAFAFAGDSNTGMYSPSADQVGLVSGGSRKLLVNADGIHIQNGRTYLYTVDANTTSTSALVLNGQEVEQRTLGSAAFTDATSYITLSGKRDYILEWYTKSAYISSNGVKHKFYKVGQLGVNGGEIILEAIIKHDVNYWDKAQSIISVSTWNSVSISVQHDAIGAVSKPIRCLIDNQRNVYIAGGVEWDSYLSWRFIYKNNFTNTSSEDYVFLSDAIPAEFVEIESGYSIRTNQETPVADDKFVSEDTIVGHLRTRGAVYTESHGTSANWKEAYDNHITGVSVTGTTTKTITLTQRDGGQISGTFTDIDNNTWRPIDDTPVDGATTESISSNWAFDHANASNPHGTTASDVGALSLSGGTITKTSTHVAQGSISASNAHLDLYNNWASNTDQKGSIITFTDNYFDGSNYNKTLRAAIKGGTDTVGNTADGYLEFYTDSAGANSPNMVMRLDKNKNAYFSGIISTASNGSSSNWKQAYDWGDHAGAGYLATTAQPRPAKPTTVTATVVGETIEIAFNQSATAAVDYYQVWAAQDSGSFSLIGQVPHTDFAATMTVVDAVFAVKGTRNYRVYAIRKGIYSDPATASRAFTSPTLEPSNLNVVTMEEAFFVQWDAPNSRFVDHYEVWVHSAPTQGELNRDLATMTYSGTNTFYMYQAANNEFHQFWVEVIES